MAIACLDRGSIRRATFDRITCCSQAGIDPQLSKRALRSSRSIEGKLTLDRLEFHWVEVDPDRIYEQAESCSSTECARARSLWLRFIAT